MIILFGIIIFYPSYFQNPTDYVKAKPTSGGPSVKDPNLRVEIVFKNDGKLDTPTTSMAFLGPNDILVLEKNKGTVQRIIEGQLQKNPVLQVKVGNEIEWGMLGIAVSKNPTKTYVFLYYTELDGGKKVLGNRLYRYELIDDKLIDPVIAFGFTCNLSYKKGRRTIMMVAKL